MSPETELRTRPLPELDAEQEIDLGRYGRLAAARWWLLVAGLAAGAVLGYLVALGGSKVYRAEATVYLGQPFSPNGNAPVQSLATNPRTVGQIVRSEAAVRRAAAKARLRPGQLRGNIASKAVSGVTARAGQTPLVAISVKGRQPRKVAEAANALAETVIEQVSGYVDVKIASFRRQLDAENAQLASIGRRLSTLSAAIENARGLSPLDQLVLISQVDNAEQRRGALLDQQSQTQQLLSLAQNVERARVVEPAVAVETTARSTRNSVLVGGAIGLILGILAALLWEPLAGRRRLSA